MIQQLPEMHVVREVLEGFLSAEASTTLLFRALRAFGPAPEDREAVLRLVDGPIAALLRERLGEDEAEELIRTVGQRLRPSMIPPTIEIEVDFDLEVEADIPTAVAPRSDRSSEPPTRVLGSVRGPVEVVIWSDSPTMGQRFLLSLGPKRVAPHTVESADELLRAGFTIAPLLAIVDAAVVGDAAAALPALKGLPDRTTRVIWGNQTPAGRALDQATRDLDTCLGLDTNDGLVTIMDLILSRTDQS